MKNTINLLSRLLLKQKKCYPLLIPALFLILGQELSAFDFRSFFFWFLVLICSYLLAVKIYRLGFLLSLIILGIFVASRPSASFERQEVRAVLVSLEKAPQISSVRNLNLTFRVLETLDIAELHPNSLIYCHFVSHLNNQAAELREGQNYYLSATIEEVGAKSTSRFDRNLFRQGYLAKCRISYLAPLKLDSKDWILGIRDRLISKVSSLKEIDDPTALFLSMSLGFDQALSIRQIEIFKGLGLAHLLVVSGFQVTLIFYFMRFLILKICLVLFSAFSKINFEWIACGIALVVSYLYAELVGFDSACTRAVIALVFLVTAKLLDRNVNFLNFIFSTFFIDLILNPYCYLLPGSQLTYAALIGIALGQKRGASFWIQLIRINFFTFITTGVVTIFWFENFFLVSFLSNIFIAPIATILSCQLGFLSLTLLYFNQSLMFEVLVWLTSLLSMALDFQYDRFSYNIGSNYLLALLSVTIIGSIWFRCQVALAAIRVPSMISKTRG